MKQSLGDKNQPVSYDADDICPYVTPSCTCGFTSPARRPPIRRQETMMKQRNTTDYGLS